MKAARRFWRGAFGVVAALGCIGSVARAEVARQDPAGFVVRTSAETTASPSDAWSVLVDPAKWWNPSHSFSGDAANLSLAAVPGGCFCETLPLPAQSDMQPRPGGVEHMRVIYVEPFRVMRLTGALGPLQSEAVRGTWTITLKPTEKGTRILFEYVVGGYMRYTTDQIAPVVDKMMMEQLTRLAMRLGPVGPVASQKVQAPAPVAVQSATATVRERRLQGPVVPAKGSNLAAAVDRLMVPQASASDSISSDAGQESKTEAQVSPTAPLQALESRRESVPVAAVNAGPLPAAAERSETARGYVQRDFLVQLEGSDVLLAPVGEDGEPVVARFAAPGLAQMIRQALRSANGQMSEGMALHCLCTGAYAEEREARVFNLLDAILEWR